MARPSKIGLDYFPLDVDFSTNEKTEAIMGEFGAKGVLFMTYLLSAVYKNGYFLKWDKLKQMQLANRIDGLNPELANQIVIRLIAYGTFNEELFNSAKVLTSQRIQKTFLDATKRRKNEKPIEYWINDNSNDYEEEQNTADEVNVYNNPSSNEVNVDINTQSKVNKSKVNKSKDKEHDQNIKKNNDIQEDFEKLWKIYPKKQGKSKAFSYYVKAIKAGVTNKQIQNGIIQYIEYIKATKCEFQYIKQGSTYFFNKSWDDELVIPKNSKQKETLPDWAQDDYQAPKKPEKNINELREKLNKSLERMKYDKGIK